MKYTHIDCGLNTLQLCAERTDAAADLPADSPALVSQPPPHAASGWQPLISLDSRALAVSNQADASDDGQSSGGSEAEGAPSDVESFAEGDTVADTPEDDTVAVIAEGDGLASADETPSAVKQEAQEPPHPHAESAIPPAASEPAAVEAMHAEAGVAQLTAGIAQQTLHAEELSDDESVAESAELPLESVLLPADSSLLAGEPAPPSTSVVTDEAGAVGHDDPMHQPDDPASMSASFESAQALAALARGSADSSLLDGESGVSDGSGPIDGPAAAGDDDPVQQLDDHASVSARPESSQVLAALAAQSAQQEAQVMPQADASSATEVALTPDTADDAASMQPAEARLAEGAVIGTAESLETVAESALPAAESVQHAAAQEPQDQPPLADTVPAADSAQAPAHADDLQQQQHAPDFEPAQPVTVPQPPSTAEEQQHPAVPSPDASPAPASMPALSPVVLIPSPALLHLDTPLPYTPAAADDSAATPASSSSFQGFVINQGSPASGTQQGTPPMLGTCQVVGTVVSTRAQAAAVASEAQRERNIDHTPGELLASQSLFVAPG